MREDTPAHEIERRRPLKERLDLIATILTAVAAVSVLVVVVVIPYFSSREPTRLENTIPPPAEHQAISGAPAIGAPSAQVAIIEYTDFQCPYCGTFAQKFLPSFRRKYVDTGRVRFVFRSLPLVDIHPQAATAAVAAACAHRQDRFWEAYNELFSSPLRSDADVTTRTESVVGDVTAFRACTSAGSLDVGADTDRARQLGIFGTPTFLVGVIDHDAKVEVRQVLRGTVSDVILGDAVDGLLKTAPTSR